MSRANPKRLLVEGDDDRRVIPYFMEHFIAWPDNNRPVHIESFNGIEDLVKPGVIEAELKTPRLYALGIIVDANASAEARWKRIRERATLAAPSLPHDLPPEGLIWETADKVRFGVWLMPDNKSRGMMETFLALFLPADHGALWSFVQSYCKEAKEKHNAPYKDIHIDKAQIHAWLSLQDSPGQSLHLAVLTRTLRIGSPFADPFVKWFRSLFSL